MANPIRAICSRWRGRIPSHFENEYTYDAFGNIRSSSEKVHNIFAYCGEQLDSATGQYYLRARFYNPVIGRFTQQDTYHGDGLNLYAYCQNNPVMYCDPTGHDSSSAADKKQLPMIVPQPGTQLPMVIPQPGTQLPAITNYNNPLTSQQNSQANHAAGDSGSRTGNDGDKKDNSGGGYRTLSKGKFKHVFNRHTYNNVKTQLEHMIKTVSRNELETDISARSFFNKNWSEQEIMSGVENAYNQLLQAGMNNGNYVVKIKGEDVTIVIDNGVFKTAWGHHHYSLEDFGL